MKKSLIGKLMDDGLRDFEDLFWSISGLTPETLKKVIDFEIQICLPNSQNANKMGYPTDGCYIIMAKMKNNSYIIFKEKGYPIGKHGLKWAEVDLEDANERLAFFREYYKESIEE